MVDNGSASGLPGVVLEFRRHAHRWLIGRPDGAVSEGVCRGCGARREFTNGFNRSYRSQPRPFGGVWLTRVAEPFSEDRQIRIIGSPDEEEIQAQRIACTHLVRGCEGAVSELQWVISEAEEQLPATKRAREILAQVLSSWRQTLKALRTAEKRA